MPERNAPTADKLRDRIDRGRAGDKVNASDPAAAPLGTDAEAAGTPPSEEQLRRAWQAEVENDARADQAEPDRGKPRPAELQQGGRNGRTAILVVAAAIVATIALSFFM
ncbi:MAG: hypothetical protein ACOCTP_02970 [Roseicyclus sp.]